jgi:uncharacterized protein
MMQMQIRVIIRAFILLVAAATSAAAETPSDSIDSTDSEAHGFATPVAKRVIQRAEHGDARSQAELGLMYATGRDVPQNFKNAVEWYRRGADQGEPTAQYFLGLMYDKGQGVQQDAVTAHKWLILAAGRATGRVREYYARVRDAVAFKLTSEQIARAQHLAAEWSPVRER